MLGPPGYPGMGMPQFYPGAYPPAYEMEFERRRRSRSRSPRRSRSRSPVSKPARSRSIKDGYDFSSALFYSVQQGPRVLGLIDLSFRNEPFSIKNEFGTVFSLKLVLPMKIGIFDFGFSVLQAFSKSFDKPLWYHEVK